MFPLERHTIFVTLGGSHAHGTARAGSDVDVRGVCVAPRQVRLSLFESFEQHEGPVPEALAALSMPALRAHPTAAGSLSVKLECVVFDVAKFLRLCAAGNPNALELLFADERDWLLHTGVWRLLHDARGMFLTRKVQHTFVGYASAQLKRIASHRVWLLHPPQRAPTRAAFGLPDASTSSRDDQNRMEQALADKIRSYGIDGIDMPKASRIALQERLEVFQAEALGVSRDDLDVALRAVAGQALHLPPEVVSTLEAERRYRAARKHQEAYQAWKTHRNPVRAETERRFGYDTKHAMHLVRLMRMGVEVFEQGTLRVRRDDADELRAIRDGALSFEQLIAESEALRGRLEVAAGASDAPQEVDPRAVDALLLTVLDAV